MNATRLFVDWLAPASVRRIAAVRPSRFDGELIGSLGGVTRMVATAMPPLSVDDARRALRCRFAADLAGLLNECNRGELNELATRAALPATAPVAQLRMTLWCHGATWEAGGRTHLGSTLQPVPVVLGGALVHQAPARGVASEASVLPRRVPPPAAGTVPALEPDTLDELLGHADRAIGVRLGPRGRDKGAWGNRAAALLGIRERGDSEPDWRGEVEVKTVPVRRERHGLWRVVEDPAISMIGARFADKLRRVLWLVRADLPGGDATILSWYLLDWDATIAGLTRRYLHSRPKGPANTTARGLYLQKRFFADAGLLATLNGSVVTP